MHLVQSKPNFDEIQIFDLRPATATNEQYYLENLHISWLQMQFYLNKKAFQIVENNQYAMHCNRYENNYSEIQVWIRNSMKF